MMEANSVCSGDSIMAEKWDRNRAVPPWDPEIIGPTRSHHGRHVLDFVRDQRI